MMEAIQTDRTPNFYFMHYRREPRQQRLETTGTASFPSFASVGFLTGGGFFRMSPVTPTPARERGCRRLPSQAKRSVSSL
jgi:hypothetical protein